MAKKVHFNIKNVHYAVWDPTNEEYGTPVHIPGAVSLNVDPTGDEVIFWADGIKYYVSYNNSGYEGELEMALIPDGFRMDVLGEEEDENKVLVEMNNAPTVYFALGFQWDNDDGDSTYFWYYNCSASRPSTSANTTEESKEVDSETLSWNCAPNADGVVRVKTKDDTTVDLTKWFDAVYEPDFTP